MLAGMPVGSGQSVESIGVDNHRHRAIAEQSPHEFDGGRFGAQTRADRGTMVFLATRIYGLIGNGSGRSFLQRVGHQLRQVKPAIERECRRLQPLRRLPIDPHRRATRPRRTWRRPRSVRANPR